MAIDVLTLSKSKKYTNLVALGLASASVDDVNKSITFTLAADGSQHTIHFSQPSDGQDGISVTGVSDKGNGVFTLLFSDGSESDPIQCIKGEKGDPGNPGYTPVKGTDYWTSEDISEIQSYIDTQIGGALNGIY